MQIFNITICIFFQLYFRCGLNTFIMVETKRMRPVSFFLPVPTETNGGIPVNIQRDIRRFKLPTVRTPINYSVRQLIFTECLSRALFGSLNFRMRARYANNCRRINTKKRYFYKTIKSNQIEQILKSSRDFRFRFCNMKIRRAGELILCP